MEVNSISQKGGCKQNLIWPSDSSGGKVVLTLLVEIVALHVEPITVDVWGFGLKFVSRSIIWGVEKHLDDFV